LFRINVGGIDYHYEKNTLAVPEALCTEEFYGFLKHLAWLDTDNLRQKQSQIRAQLILLKSAHLTCPEFFIEVYDYSELADFNNAFAMLIWHKFNPASIVNLDAIEPPKSKYTLAKNLKSRFPNTKAIHNYGRHPPVGLENPNFIPAFDLPSALMRKELGIGQSEIQYNVNRAARFAETTKKDPTDKKKKLWVGNPFFTGSKEFDAMTVLQQMRTYTKTPEKFPYALGSKGLNSFSKLVDNVNSGSVNLVQDPFRMSLIWHIMAAKDCLLEGFMEWAEMLIPLVKPECLNAEQLDFFDTVQDCQPNVVNGYQQLNSKLQMLAKLTKGEKLSKYKLNQIMLFLVQHFPLKNLGNDIEERKMKLPNTEYPEDFAAIYKKAVKLKSTFAFKGQSAVTSDNLQVGSKRPAESVEEYAQRQKEKNRRRNQKNRARRKKNRAKQRSQGNDGT